MTEPSSSNTASKFSSPPSSKPLSPKYVSKSLRVSGTSATVRFRWFNFTIPSQLSETSAQTYRARLLKRQALARPARGSLLLGAAPLRPFASPPSRAPFRFGRSTPPDDVSRSRVLHAPAGSSSRASRDGGGGCPRIPPDRLRPEGLPSAGRFGEKAPYPERRGRPRQERARPRLVPANASSSGQRASPNRPPLEAVGRSGERLR